MRRPMIPPGGSWLPFHGSLFDWNDPSESAALAALRRGGLSPLSVVKHGARWAVHHHNGLFGNGPQVRDGSTDASRVSVTGGPPSSAMPPAGPGLAHRNPWANGHPRVRRMWSWAPVSM